MNTTIINVLSDFVLTFSTQRDEDVAAGPQGAAGCVAEVCHNDSGEPLYTFPKHERVKERAIRKLQTAGEQMTF